MRVPYRKPGKYSQLPSDPAVSKEKFNELKSKLNRLKNSRPQAAAEVARLAELGDFSENAAYQHAKGRLRGINNAISFTESQLNQAKIIESPKLTDTVALGHTVTIENNDKQKNFQILGSSETNPERGIISHHSPLGSALMGRRVGEQVVIKLANKEVVYRIVKIQ